MSRVTRQGNEGLLCGVDQAMGGEESGCAEVGIMEKSVLS